MNTYKASSAQRTMMGLAILLLTASIYLITPVFVSAGEPHAEEMTIVHSWILELKDEQGQPSGMGSYHATAAVDSSGVVYGQAKLTDDQGEVLAQFHFDCVKIDIDSRGEVNGISLFGSQVIDSTKTSHELSHIMQADPYPWVETQIVGYFSREGKTSSFVIGELYLENGWPSRVTGPEVEG